LRVVDSFTSGLHTVDLALKGSFLLPFVDKFKNQRSIPNFCSKIRYGCVLQFIFKFAPKRIHFGFIV